MQTPGTKPVSDVIALKYEEVEEAILNYLYDNRQTRNLTSLVVVDDLGLDIPIPLNEKGLVEMEYHYTTYDDDDYDPNDNFDDPQGE